MKWQLLLVGLFLLACVGSVGAVRENFQSWGSNVITVGPHSTDSTGLSTDLTKNSIYMYMRQGLNL